MSVGRRKVRLEDQSAWIFNKMVDAYEARPPYPVALVDTLASLAGGAGARMADVGAGIGHLALPLARRGLKVTALEPASAMLERLSARAQLEGVDVAAVHGAAEAMPLPTSSFDLVVVSDAVHFLDAERTSHELKRVLTPAGALALITCDFTPTPFMGAVVEAMARAAPRRPRDVSDAIEQLLAGPRVAANRAVFTDENPVEPETLEGILRSISFIGPAMNAERWAAFRERIHAIEHEPRWARTFTLYSGRRRGSKA